MRPTGLSGSDFTLVATTLRAWPAATAAGDGVSTPAWRLISAARTAAEQPAAIGPADLAALVRHVLRAEDERAGGEPKRLRVPAVDPWPRGDMWEPYGLRALADGDGQWVRARPWTPAWLDAAGADPAADACRGVCRTPLGELPSPPADPFLTSVTGLTSYRSSGQREAIRTLLAAPSTATIVGNLPTGTGKSLVAYLPTLAANVPGTTLVVVPTTSLALDQERAFRELVADLPQRDRFPDDLAYYGELGDGVRAAIRQRLRDGSQAILFTSPESAGRSLSPALYAAAERGLVRAVVVDEAHVVSQWGTDFRPAFQAFASVRADLLQVATTAGAPFPTLLLSATLNEDSLLTLAALFGRPGPLELISSVALRHEPSYWLASCEDEPLRRARVLEAIRHLPRPLVLYTTKVADAKQWHEQLVAAGFRRCTVVAGDTSATDRREAIERLRDGTLDLVVATSAFGLGVDQPDLRAVVHACVPETLDRYYQEVGRGGRDGRPSVALLVTGPGDARIAEELATRRTISLRRGFERWRTMQLGATSQDGRLRLPLYVSPPDLAGDTDENRAWNLRTLLLMDRSGLLTLEAATPPRQGAEESDAAWEARRAQTFEDYAAHAIVRLRHTRLADRTVWERAVGAARRATFAADLRARGGMAHALQPGAELCTLFAEAYRVEQTPPGLSAWQTPVVVAASCGGCPGCRAAGRPARRLVPPVPWPAQDCERRWSAALEPSFAGHRALALLYEPGGDWAATLERLLERLARHGMWCLLAPDALLRRPAVRQLYRIAPGGAVFQLDRWERLHAPSLPTALVVAPGARIPAGALDDGGPPRVVLLPDGVRHPRHDTASVRQYHVAVTTAQDVLRS